MSAQTWFITGVSSGFGLELALQALQAGHRVIGTVRSRSRAADNVKRIEAQNGSVLELDVTDAAACEAVWKQAAALHGGIDVLVNNAGMAYLGALEDFTDDEFRAQMDVNVYGPFRLIKAALPGFRQRNSGTIVNITSIAGIDGLPSCGLYAASKFAVEGMTESLVQELTDYAIDVLLVEPGAFRTNFLGAFQTSASTAALPLYAPAQGAFEKFRDAAGKQPGDPVKAAKRMVEVISGSGDAGRFKGKVARLPLGSDCVKRFGLKVERLQRDLDATREVAVSTDY